LYRSVEGPKKEES